MKIEKFEDILIWQKAKELTILVYQLFGKLNDFRFRDQIQSASVSIMNNIAEGYERVGDKEFVRFLYISKGSCGEVRSMLYLALEFKYITHTEFKRMYELSIEISRMIQGFIKKIR